MTDQREKRALITGITGQDGSYLAELLLAKGYEVHGVIRRTSTFNTQRIDHLYADPHDSPAFKLHYGDLNEGHLFGRILERYQPQEVYNLGAQSHVRVSFDQSEYTANSVAIGTLRLLEAVREYSERSGVRVKVYQAGSSEMYGSAPPPQNEDTPFHPRSPYAVSKVAAHWFGRNFREAYGMFITNGILFNHESPRRGETFVTRKITRAVGRIHEGLQQVVYLGNLEARRDWGFAGDYVEAMWLMLQQDAPGDYVVATGESHSVQEFLEASFERAGLDWRKHVKIDPTYFRPSEVDHLRGDSSKTRAQLGWTPKVSFQELVRLMVDGDLELARRERTLADAGYGTTQTATAS
jgi:GDPmannose 4,6-dehydratase